jgi:hypothetical protein
MPRYFFGLNGPTWSHVDEEGEELPDDKAAHRAALQTARELAADWRDKAPGHIVVRTADGRIVSEVPLPPEDFN